MHAATPAVLAIPPIVHRLQPLVNAALRIVIPMGPNVLMTIRGRKSGLPRTVPVAILRADGRDVVFSPFGEVAWVHNLRAAGRAEIRRGRRRRDVTAVELTYEEAARYLEIGLGEFMGAPPVIGPMVAGWYGISRRSRATTTQPLPGVTPRSRWRRWARTRPDAYQAGGGGGRSGSPGVAGSNAGGACRADPPGSPAPVAYTCRIRWLS